MPRKGKRTKVAKGVYRDSGGYEVRVTVGGVTYGCRLPTDATRAEWLAARADLEAKGRSETPRAERGSLRAAAPIYLALVKHLATWDDREDHLNAWIARIGDVQRHRITERDVLAARAAWIADGLSPKTVNHRCDTLRNLYHRLDGKRARTPCDDVEHLPVARTPIQRIPESLMLAIDAKLQEKERDGVLPTAKTRARFRVLVSTGKRPVEIMRAKRGDVDLRARVWVPRDAKGGFTPGGLYLNDDMCAAWQLFVDAEAWGPFNHAAFVRVLRNSGWPDHVRVYQARHNTWIAASERGADLDDIAAGAGHTDSRLTRRSYVPVLNSRMQRLGEMLEGRFKGWPVVPKRGSAENTVKDSGETEGQS
jgi:integrase